MCLAKIAMKTHRHDVDDVAEHAKDDLGRLVARCAVEIGLEPELNQRLRRGLDGICVRCRRLGIRASRRSGIVRVASAAFSGIGGW